MTISSKSQNVVSGNSTRIAGIFLGVRAVFELIAFYFFWALFGLLSLCWSLVATLLTLVVPLWLGGPLGRLVINRGFRMFVGLLRITGLIRCDLAALGALQREAPLIIASNHPGRLDVLLMISHLPGTVCIIKAALWKNLFIGGGARFAGYIRNDTPMDMIRTAVRELHAGRNLLVFPEGTRSTEKSPEHFQGGFALIAKFSGVPVQTVFIENVSGYLGKSWPLFKRPTLPLEFRVRLGRRFEASNDPEAFVAELEGYYRKELRPGLSPATQP